MTEESKLLLNKIELIAKNILDLSMPESKLEDMSADILDLCDKIKQNTAANCRKTWRLNNGLLR